MEREQRAAVSPELLEQLLKSVEKPEELLGPDGLLHRLKGADGAHARGGDVGAPGLRAE